MATPRPPAPAPRSAARLPREVRIIGGQWKRTRLPVPDLPGLRPTPDRVRETLFNWLGQDLSGWAVIDAFAGTGALGLEAASRGAVRVLLMEQDGAQADALRAVVRRLAAGAVQVEKGNAINLLQRQAPASWDLVLLDPPFDAGLYDQALAAAVTLLRPEGWLYLEAPEAWSDEAIARYGLRRERDLRAGAVHAHLLRPNGAGSGP